MTHPDPECNEYQAQFLSKCSPDQRSMHELVFKVGNATFRYQQLAKDFNPNEADWNEWLEGLEDPMKTAVKEKGFQGQIDSVFHTLCHGKELPRPRCIFTFQRIS